MGGGGAIEDPTSEALEVDSMKIDASCRYSTDECTQGVVTINYSAEELVLEEYIKSVDRSSVTMMADIHIPDVLVV